ncbi:MAG: hypothetical protein Q9162_006589 [Coniocarpon cinnabarinum]
MASPSNVDSVLTTLNNLESTEFSTEDDRVRVINAAEKLVSRLEKPFEPALKHVWYYVGLQTVSAGESRLLRHLSAMNILENRGPESYEMGGFARALGEGGADWIHYLFEVNAPGFHNFPAYCADIKYQNPLHQAKGNWQHLQGSDQGLFETFGTMKALNDYKHPWTNIFPVSELVKRTQPEHAILVDVGGGRGGDLEKVAQMFPDLPKGSLVLQDLPDVVKDLSLKPSIRAMPHDMFTSQPVKGATAYFLHTVLHDWPDDKASDILRNLHSAVERGRSSVLLYETVMTSTESELIKTASDLTMMCLLGAVERTEEMWKKVVEAAGFKIKKIWSNVGSMESVIELTLS